MVHGPIDERVEDALTLTARGRTQRAALDIREERGIRAAADIRETLTAQLRCRLDGAKDAL
jgi:hypothetical protein